MMGQFDLRASTMSRPVFLAAAAICLLISSSAAAEAQDACESIEQTLTDELAQDYAAPAAAVFEGEVTPEEVEVMTVLRSGTWSVAYVQTPVSDPGYMFFEEVEGEMQFQDVWGGMASASERPEITAWAEDLGAPADLATCFADMAATDDDE
ncbi:hypothetical protein [Devosia nitrariae]|uniref:Lipoprotein n=1 Tax=Devosia nitrariae TaxID=2071872 RepID=A0ABQ5W6G5_9HYPH|nr:hypothetical protein [Devosia nitrariae]GLQ55462.1 hypothetical protein GCM10010862_27210 [Devosia nitrariae]